MLAEVRELAVDKPTIIEGGRTTDKKRAGKRLSLSDHEQIYCWRCEKFHGVASSAAIEITIAPRRKPDGSLTGGTKRWVCVYCLGRGKITELSK